MLGYMIILRVASLSSSLSDISTQFVGVGPSAVISATGGGAFSAAAANANSPNSVQRLGPYYNTNLTILENLKEIKSDREAIQLLGFVYSMIIILRFFKGFRGQPRIAIMALSLIKSGIDMLHFMLVFSLIYLNYSVGGWILFGTQLEEWNSLLKAMGVTLKILFGDFDYHRIYAIQPFIATLWFFSYIVLTCFVVLNLLTGLVYDKYMNVQHSTNFRGGADALEPNARYIQGLPHESEPGHRRAHGEKEANRLREVPPREFGRTCGGISLGFDC